MGDIVAGIFIVWICLLFLGALVMVTGMTIEALKDMFWGK